ncbi:MAG: hypothetical protein LBQ33_02945, partial [Oscillospiraceae bacterium]|jgi:hypothetical protein|nr:hypothetical protein [Oscillospiraceae bacterium]
VEYPAGDTVAIAFAKEASIFGTPPTAKKDAYKTENAEDFVLTALNSVAQTLIQNYCATNVLFLSETGGNLTFENGGKTFTFDAKTPWDYDTAKKGVK